MRRAKRSSTRKNPVPARGWKPPLAWKLFLRGEDGRTTVRVFRDPSRTNLANLAEARREGRWALLHEGYEDAWIVEAAR